jgi:hypothetical protein
MHLCPFTHLVIDDGSMEPHGPGVSRYHCRLAPTFRSRPGARGKILVVAGMFHRHTLEFP